MRAPRISTQETTIDAASVRDAKGEAHGQILRKSESGADRSALALAVLIALFPDSGYRPPTGDLLNGVLQWLHVFFGITWIGLLYYFNFVQTPTMPTVPAELKPGVSKYIAPKALFYFRWGAAFTVLTGLLLAWSYGELVEALTFSRRLG